MCLLCEVVPMPTPGYPKWAGCATIFLPRIWQTLFGICYTGDIKINVSASYFKELLVSEERLSKQIITMCCVELYDGHGRTAVYGYESGGLCTSRWGQSAFHVAVRRVHTHMWHLGGSGSRGRRAKGVGCTYSKQFLYFPSPVFCNPCPLECVARPVTSFEWIEYGKGDRMSLLDCVTSDCCAPLARRPSSLQALKK